MHPLTSIFCQLIPNATYEGGMSVCVYLCKVYDVFESLDNSSVTPSFNFLILILTCVEFVILSSSLHP